jgi:hypothetical protein
MVPAGGDFFGWSTAFSMMEIVLQFLPPIDAVAVLPIEAKCGL